MSSTTNVTIAPAPPPVDVAVTAKRDMNLGQLLGQDGCKLFEQELVRLCNEKGSAWRRYTVGPKTIYECSTTQGLPAGVPNLKVQLSVFPGVIEVQQQWTLQGLDSSRPEVPKGTRKTMQKIVNRTVNQALVRVVANQIEQRIAERTSITARLRQELLVRQRTPLAIQIHARLSQGGLR